MKRVLWLCVLLLSGCSDPRDTPVPSKLDQLATIKPQVDKLTEEERAAFAAFVTRTAMMSAMSGKADGMPPVTIRQAIDQQRKFVADMKAQEEAAAALKAKTLAEQEAAMKVMREAVTATLLRKMLVPDRGMSGIVIDEKLSIDIAIKNNTAKEIAGVKGTLAVTDMFGDELAGFNFSTDESIKAGEVYTWSGSRSTRFGLNGTKDRKFAETPEGKYKVAWKPAMIVFADGSKLTAPTQ